jgi:hypothetical protein
MAVNYKLSGGFGYDLYLVYTNQPQEQETKIPIK